MLQTGKLRDTETGEMVELNRNTGFGVNGHLLNLEFQAIIDPAKVSLRKPNLWRYREALPVDDDKHIVSFEEGFTPLLPLTFLGKKVWIKQEQLFTTGSYKDRGATVLISKANELGVKDVVQDSSGNAGCAIAAYAAMANMKCEIFLPADTSLAKIAQIKAYGASIHKINGSREDTAQATLEAAQKTYYASHCWNPFFFHGTKTFAYEVCEQLNWKAPDAVVLPAGNGTLVIGCYIGFMDLYKAGIISKMPKLIAVQAENCSPLANMFRKNLEELDPVSSSLTLAEGIAIAEPVRAKQIVQYVKETHGTFITVNEEEIKTALIDCAKKGFYIEPTSAAAIAGLIRYIGMSEEETIVSLFSGTGLKATDKIMKLLAI